MHEKARNLLKMSEDMLFASFGAALKMFKKCRWTLFSDISEGCIKNIEKCLENVFQTFFGRFRPEVSGFGRLSFFPGE